MGQRALEAAENIMLRSTALLTRPDDTNGAARYRPRNLLPRPQVRDVALSEFEHMAQSLVLLAFEHLLAVIEDVIGVLRQRARVDRCTHAFPALVALKVSKLDAGNASLWRQLAKLNHAQVRLVPAPSYVPHF